ncbi:MAG: YwiC-like family protein [Anaerolineales bacterium]|nr:YwiC-like family protein [Anaerolineales bacterium]
MSKIFRRHIALPQDHGSWVFILSPLLIGLFAGERFTPASINLIIAAMGAFLLRQPVSIAVKAYAGRRSREDLPAARFWMLVYGVIIVLALGGLVTAGFAYVLYLAIPGIPVFAWHLYLVSKRAERKQAGVEILATGALALAAPAAYWVGIGHYDLLGWALWLLTWLQSAASIVYAYLRLEQRGQAEDVERSELWRIGKRALQYTSFNLALSLVLGWSAWLPSWIFVPYLLQWLETIWGITHPATGWKPTAIGVRQLVVSTLFTVLFIVFWRF